MKIEIEIPEPDNLFSVAERVGEFWYDKTSIRTFIEALLNYHKKAEKHGGYMHPYAIKAREWIENFYKQTSNFPIWSEYENELNDFCIFKPKQYLPHQSSI